jgi:hypothetical protein
MTSTSMFCPTCDTAWAGLITDRCFNCNEFGLIGHLNRNTCTPTVAQRNHTPDYERAHGTSGQ